MDKIIIELLQNLTERTMDEKKAMKVGFFVSFHDYIDCDLFLEWWSSLGFEEKKGKWVYETGENNEECRIKIGTLLYFLKEENITKFYDLSSQIRALNNS